MDPRHPRRESWLSPYGQSYLCATSIRCTRCSQPTRFHIAHRHDIQIAGPKSADVESVPLRRHVPRRRSHPLPYKHRHPMLADAEQQLRSRLVPQIRQIRAIQRHILRQILRQIEAERNLPLEPRLHRMPVRRHHLRRSIRCQRGHMLIADFRHQSCKLRGSHCVPAKRSLHEVKTETNQQRRGH